MCVCVSISVYIYMEGGEEDFYLPGPQLDIKHREINMNIPALTELLWSIAHKNKVLNKH